MTDIFRLYSGGIFCGTALRDERPEGVGLHPPLGRYDGGVKVGYALGNDNG